MAGMSPGHAWPRSIWPCRCRGENRNGRAWPPCSIRPATVAPVRSCCTARRASASPRCSTTSSRRRATFACCAPRAWSRSRRWPSPRCTGCCGRCWGCSTGSPAPQARALRVAFGQQEGPAVDRSSSRLADAVRADRGGRGRAGAVRRRRRALARRRVGRRAAVRRPPAAGRPGGAGVRRPGRRPADVPPDGVPGLPIARPGRRRRRGRCSPSRPASRCPRRSASGCWRRPAGTRWPWSSCRPD